MVEKTNRGIEQVGLGPQSHGSHLFINGPMGTFVFSAQGCLAGGGAWGRSAAYCAAINVLIH